MQRIVAALFEKLTSGRVASKRFFKIFNYSPNFYIGFSVLAVCLSLLVYSSYQNYIQETHRALRNEARHITATLEEIFDSANQLINYFARQISISNYEDLNNIIHIIGKQSGEEDSVSWINIGWINNKGMYLYERNSGKIDPPVSLLHRPYLQLCMKKPWNFFVTQVVVGAGLGIRKVPGGVGITDKNGHYIGTLCFGFKLMDLNRRVRQKINMANYDENNLSYVILDKDLHIVLQSPDNEIDVESSFYKDHIGSSNIFTNEEGLNTDPIQYQDVNYVYYKKTRNFPYYILMGISYKKFYMGFMWKLLPFFLTIIFVGCVSVIVNFLGRKKFFQEISRAEKAKTSYLNRKQDFIASQLSIICESSTLLNQLIKEGSAANFLQNSQLKLLRLIDKSAQLVQAKVSNEILRKEVDIEAIIKECILIQTTYAYTKRVFIDCNISPQVVKINIDPLKLEQVILSILSLSIDLGPEKININIEISKISKDNKQLLQVLISDNGQAFDQESWKRIEQHTDNPYLMLNYDDINKIVMQHGGNFSLESQYAKGKKFRIILPYMENVEETIEQEENIIKFPSR